MDEATDNAPAKGPVDDWQPNHREPFTIEQGNRLYLACTAFDTEMKARREYPEDITDPDPLWLIHATFARARRVAKETKLPPDLVLDAVEAMVSMIQRWPETAKELWHDGWRVSDASSFEKGLRLLCQIGESQARRAAFSSYFPQPEFPF